MIRKKKKKKKRFHSIPADTKALHPRKNLFSPFTHTHARYISHRLFLLRAMTSGLRSRSGETQASQLSECGHDRSCLDFGSDRDIKCRTCWENREILIQRLIEPFQHAFGSLGVDAAVNGIAVVPPLTAPVVPPKAQPRSLRPRAGSKRTRSESRNSPSSSPARGSFGNGHRTGDNSGPSPSSPSRTRREPEEDDCIRVMETGLTRSRSEDSMRPVAKSPKSKSSTVASTGGGTKWWEDASSRAAGTKGRDVKKHQERSPSASASVSTSKPKAGIQSTKKGQQTLLSFFAPKPAGENGIGGGVATARDPAKTPDPIPSTINTTTATTTTSNSPGKPALGNATAMDPSLKAKEKRPSGGVVRKPPRPGTRRSRRDSKKDAVNYKEDSDSDVIIEG